MIKNLHILFISSWYPSKIHPTNGNFVKDLATCIATKHDVSVLFAIGDFKQPEKYVVDLFEENNVKTVIVYFRKHASKTINFYRKLRALTIGLSHINTFDLIHCNVVNPMGIVAYLLSVLKRKPFIITAHWSGFLSESNYENSFFQKLFSKISIKKAQYVIPVSKRLKNAMIYKGYKGNYNVIGNVVATQLFTPQKNSNPLFEIVHVSNFSNEQKNINGILNVVKKLSEESTGFIFKIVGDGDLNSLKKQVSFFKIPSKNIKIIGTQTPKGIAKVLQNAHLYISFSNFETFGIVMAEALASGTPVITTNTGILTELKQEKYITIIPVNDEKRLLKEIVFHINHRPIFNGVEMHKKITENFSCNTISNAYSNVYRKSIINYSS